MIDRRLAKNLDTSLLVTVAALVAFGLLSVFSATHAKAPGLAGGPFHYLVRQAIAGILGIIALVAVLNVDYRYLEKLAKPFYWGNVILLSLVLALGKIVSGAQSWFRVGGMSFEPAEVAKVAIIVTLAKHISGREDMRHWSGIFSAFLHAGIPILLIMLQPDLGTGLIFLGILFGMLFVGGAQPKHLLTIVLVGAVLAVPTYLWVLKPYQQARIMMFVNPYADPTGNGYNVIQSMIAIGSGRFLGKGLFGGTQTQLNFVPEHHTDFIFSVVGEEFGFVGSLVLLGLYFFLLWRGIKIIGQAKDQFGALLATGVVSMLLFHILINIGMNLGVMPVTGIPLPFMSFGGTSLIANLLGIGIISNVYMRRQKILF